ncbi:MAG: cystathionine gamma-synthase, partial [Thiobacillaceae bacterium]|nr:cystathionine gamma-synthase [Thiobacillaceae bacterium]
MKITIVSKHPPGGRCALYAGYAEVLARHLAAEVVVEFSDVADAHAGGYPSLIVDGKSLLPADGVILMPADVCGAVAAHGVAADALLGLIEALEAPL